MKKFLIFGILIAVLAGVFITPLGVSAAIGDACTTSSGSPGIVGGDDVNGYSCVKSDSAVGKSITPTGNTLPSGATDTSDSGIAGWIWKKFAQGIGYVLITISSLALLLSGWIFDAVVKFTIIDTAKNLGGGSGGIGDSITAAWRVLRDIANMAFIFVLLYAAFKAMFDTNFSGFGTTIRNIIIIALLINFSLFFSKVVIDASNIVAVGFYRSITNTTVSYNTNTTTNSSFEKTISAGYMNMLGLQTFFGSNILDNGKLSTGGQILTVGIITAVFMLITSVILLIAGIMFVARFVILIFLMILSPLAFIAFIIPGMQKRFNEWKDALVSQAFFAPLYFALTWVVFKVGSSLIGVLGKPEVEWSEITTNPKGVLPLIINYVLIIGFSIAALVLSKQMATKGSAGTAMKSISGGIGIAAVGSAAKLGRSTVGRGSRALLNSDRVRNIATDGKLGSKYIARAGLATAKKGAESSFDLRASKKLGAVPGVGGGLGMLGKAGGKGGFSEAVNKKAKDKAKYAKEVYGQTDEEKAKAKELKPEYEAEKFAEEERIIEKRTTEAKERLDKAKKLGTPAVIKVAEDYKKKIEYRNKKKIFKDEEYTTEFKEGTKANYDKYAKAGERRQKAYADRIEGGKIKKRAKQVGSTILGGVGSGSAGIAAGAVAGGTVGSLAGPIGTAVGAGAGAAIGGVAGIYHGFAESWKAGNQGDKEAAKKVRDQATGPSKEKKLADAYKAIADTDTPSSTTPPPSTPPSGGSGSSSTGGSTGGSGSSGSASSGSTTSS